MINNSGSQDISQKLISGCRKGDFKSQLQVYKILYKSVFGRCMNICNDPVSAEHIMHETFLLAFEKINTYDNNINFLTWIINFIKNAE